MTCLGTHGEAPDLMVVMAETGAETPSLEAVGPVKVGSHSRLMIGKQWAVNAAIQNHTHSPLVAIVAAVVLISVTYFLTFSEGSLGILEGHVLALEVLKKAA